jgi:radical SAM protein with 4Fe4S-binding SPASM domain
MIKKVGELEVELSSTYVVKLMADIGDLTTGPGEAMKYLSRCRQPEYSPKDRIVLYSAFPLTNDILRHLYDTTNFLDISNWFVLICAPAESKTLIESICIEYSTDPVPFQFLEADLEHTRPLGENFLLPDSICAIPWSNLEIQPNGNITPCCVTKNAVLGNINTTTLHQAFHGEKMTSLRQRLLKGKKPSECDYCWELEDRGLASIRTHNIKRLKKDLLTRYLDHPEISTIDIKFGTTCNFKCRVCGPGFSSLFAQEEHRFRGIPLIPHNRWEESQGFLDDVITHLPNISNIDMYGGEPFLLKKFSRVLDLAIKQDFAKNIRLHYNSNGSIWPKEFIDLWPFFRAVDILFSIDDIGGRFELQRGGRWEDVERNILNLKNLNLPNLSINIMPTISVMNIYYLGELYDWCKQHGFQLVINHVRSSKGHELSSLTKRAKDIILSKYKDHPWDEMQKILTMIQSQPDSNGELFCKSTKWFDQIRQQDFSNHHREIAEAMGYK